jgi:hypothetical protein
VAGQRREPISQETLDLAERVARLRLKRRDGREKAAAALQAVRAASAALRSLYGSLDVLDDDRPELERRNRLATELMLEEQQLAMFVEVPPTQEEAKPGESLRDVMVRVLADPTPQLDFNYPPTRGTKPLASQRQIAEWLTGCNATARDMEAANGIVDRTAREVKRANAAKSEAARGAEDARKESAAVQEERSLRREIMRMADAILDDK